MHVSDHRFPERTKRVKRYRLFANSFWIFGPLFVAGALLMHSQSALGRVVNSIGFLPIALAVTLLGALSGAAWVRFRWGVILCPRCGEPFYGGSGLLIGDSCTSCHLRLSSSGPGSTSSNRWRGP
jgi:hypothetical protein